MSNLIFRGPLSPRPDRHSMKIFNQTHANSKLFSFHILLVQCLHLYFTSLTVLKVPTSTWPRLLLQGYYIFCFYFFSTGSASTGSTKSATMELYTSSYNETMSGGGETLSSISEKSCISDQTRPISGNGNNQTSNGLVGHGGVLQGGGGGFPPQAYLMVGHYCI